MSTTMRPEYNSKNKKKANVHNIKRETSKNKNFKQTCCCMYKKQHGGGYYNPRIILFIHEITHFSLNSLMGHKKIALDLTPYVCYSRTDTIYTLFSTKITNCH